MEYYFLKQKDLFFQTIFVESNFYIKYIQYVFLSICLVTCVFGVSLSVCLMSIYLYCTVYLCLYTINAYIYAFFCRCILYNVYGTVLQFTFAHVYCKNLRLQIYQLICLSIYCVYVFVTLGQCTYLSKSCVICLSNSLSVYPSVNLSVQILCNLSL